MMKVEGTQTLRTHQKRGGGGVYIQYYQIQLEMKIRTESIMYFKLLGKAKYR
jgi:hypothetical protein